MIFEVGHIIVVVKQSLQADEDEAEELNLSPFSLLNKEEFEHDLIPLGVGLVNDQR